VVSFLLTNFKAWGAKSTQAFLLVTILLGSSLSISGCASTDQLKLKEARERFEKGDSAGAENLLYSPDVLDHRESRLQHYFWLSSLAMSEGQFEKALFYLERSRSLATELRSDQGAFDWFGTDYKSNPIEFSYLYYYLILADLSLAESGETQAWSIPELKTKKNGVLVPAQNFPARKYSAKEIADFRARARSELMAWDSHLTVLKRTYPGEKLYQEDLLARMIASYVHGSASASNDRRTAEILSSQAQENLPKYEAVLPTLKSSDQDLKEVLTRLKERLQKKSSDSLVLIEAGVMPVYKNEKTVIGLSTLFKNVQDPVLRFELERIGLQVLLHFAPEFGLVALTGAVAGAVSSGAEGEDSPHFISEAVDQGIGFQLQFPSLQLPDPLAKTSLILTDSTGSKLEQVLPILSPLQEIIGVELRNRMKKEFVSKGVRVGLQYLAILIPAVKAYQDADREQNFIKKLAILAGYFMAKKAIDHANSPDLRSWSLLPNFISGNVLKVPPGQYQAQFKVEHAGGEQVFDLGLLQFKDAGSSLIYRKVGVISNFGVKKRGAISQIAP